MAPMIHVDMRTALTMLAASLLLSGCILPAPLVDDLRGERAQSRAFDPCSLDAVQARRELPRADGIAGTATPFVIRAAAAGGTDRRVRSGESVSFALDEHDVVAAPGRAFRLDALDSAGHPLADGTPLTDGSILRLTPGDVAAATDPVLVLVKADVPDQTRAATCDAQLRDGDFVFLRSLNPSVWVSANPAGQPDARAAALVRAIPPTDGSADPACAQDHETCRTDVRGGLVCAWSPSCAR